MPENYEMGFKKPNPQKSDEKKQVFTPDGVKLTPKEVQDMREKTKNDPEGWREQK